MATLRCSAYGVQSGIWRYYCVKEVTNYIWSTKSENNQLYIQNSDEVHKENSDVLIWVENVLQNRTTF